MEIWHHMELLDTSLDETQFSHLENKPTGSLILVSVLRIQCDSGSRLSTGSYPFPCGLPTPFSLPTLSPGPTCLWP